MGSRNVTNAQDLRADLRVSSPTFLETRMIRSFAPTLLTPETNLAQGSCSVLPERFISQSEPQFGLLTAPAFGSLSEPQVMPTDEAVPELI